MCKYCGTDDYRKIYENHVGPILIDDEGRTYEIHHLDGNRSNNVPENLISVSIREHYSIHESQHDWNACLRMAERMALSPAEKSELGRKHALQQVADGKNAFVGGDLQRRTNAKLIEAGQHPFQDPIWKSKTQRKRVEMGNHNWSGPESNQKRIDEGTHNLMKRLDGSSVSSDRVTNGTHNMLGGKLTQAQLKAGTHPSQIKKTCPDCGTTCDSANFARYHKDSKCQTKKVKAAA